MSHKLIIDGNHLAARCWAVMGQLVTSKGVHSGAIHGFLRGMLWAQRETRTPSHDLIVCWDGGLSPYRKSIYPEYKANRRKDQTEEEKAMRLAYIHQLNALREVLTKMGIAQSHVYDVEADDLIAVLTHFYKQSRRVIVYSGDKDMHQLCDASVDIFDPSKGLLTLPKILEKWELEGIDKIVWYRAMTGDKSDNIFGIPSIGDVRARMLLKYSPYTDVPVPESAHKYFRIMLDNQHILMRNIQLMRLPTDFSDTRFFSSEQAKVALDLCNTVPERDDLEVVKFLRSWELNSALESSV